MKLRIYADAYIYINVLGEVLGIEIYIVAIQPELDRVRDQGTFKTGFQTLFLANFGRSLFHPYPWNRLLQHLWSMDK